MFSEWFGNVFRRHRSEKVRTRSSNGLLRFLRGSNLQSRLDRWDETWRKWGCSPNSIVLIPMVPAVCLGCSVAQSLTLAGLRS